MQAHFCRKCGSALKPDAKFCGSCGTPVVQLSTADPAPKPTPAPKQPKTEHSPVNKKANGSRGVCTTILAVFLCVVIFVFSSITVGMFDIRQAISAGSVSEMLDSVLNYSRLENMPADTLFADAADDQTIIDWAVEAIENAYADADNPIEISAQDVEIFLEDSTFLDFLAEELEAYTLDITKETGESGVASDEVRQLLEENIDLINEITGEQMGDENIDYIVEQIESTGMLDYATVSELKENAPAAYYSFRIGLSYWVISLFALLTLLFVLLLAKCNKWNMPRTCGDTGITLTVQGGILVLSTVFSILLPELWGAMFGPAYLASVVIGAILANSLLCSVVVLVLGVVLILVKVFCRKK